MRTNMLVTTILLFGVVLSACAPMVTQQLPLVERAPNDPLIDIDPEGDSLGDLLVFSNEIYDGENENQVGMNSGYCIRTVVGELWECFITIMLNDGSLTVQGPFYDDGRDSFFSVTGGTGGYAGAQGEAKLTIRNPEFTEFGFDFDIIRPGLPSTESQ